MKPQMHGNPCFFSLIWLRLFTALYGPHLFNSHHYMSTYGYGYSAVSIIVCKFIRKHTNTSITNCMYKFTEDIVSMLNTINYHAEL